LARANPSLAPRTSRAGVSFPPGVSPDRDSAVRQRNRAAHLPSPSPEELGFASAPETTKAPALAGSLFSF
jgi:hypothetical protein